MKYDNQKIINELACDLANYINDSREFDDYLEYCDENDLDHENFLNNSTLKGAHVYAKTKALLFHLEQLDQKQNEGDI